VERHPLGRLIAEKTDIPPGVVNIVTSSDHLVGEVLTTSPDVDMVAFTGSTATGRRIMAAAAETLKPVFLELGGKSVNLVLDDADFGAALPRRGHGVHPRRPGLRHPHPPPRAPRPLRRGRRARRRRLRRRWPYGDPTDPANLMGPLVSRASASACSATSRRARPRAPARHRRRRARAPRPGFFVEPTLFADVDNSMTIAQEEIFGPVLVVIPYDDDDDAVRIANDSPTACRG
jgi:aldehyde dehydrogenase (NAD+)